jgi:predicted transcriptional regulator
MTTEMVNSSIRLPVDLSERLKLIADADHRSLQATMVAALEAFAASRVHRARVAAIGDRIATEHAEILARLA